MNDKAVIDDTVRKAQQYTVKHANHKTTYFIRQYQLMQRS